MMDRISMEHGALSQFRISDFGFRSLKFELCFEQVLLQIVSI
jgi:hypothetical protein